jgi:hypothetical protein
MGEQLQILTCMAVPVCCGRQGAAGGTCHGTCTALLRSLILILGANMSMSQCLLVFDNTCVCHSSTTTGPGLRLSAARVDSQRSSCCCWCVYGLHMFQVQGTKHLIMCLCCHLQVLQTFRAAQRAAGESLGAGKQPKSRCTGWVSGPTCCVLQEKHNRQHVCSGCSATAGSSSAQSGIAVHGTGTEHSLPVRSVHSLPVRFSVEHCTSGSIQAAEHWKNQALGSIQAAKHWKNQALGVQLRALSPRHPHLVFIMAVLAVVS